MTSKTDKPIPQLPGGGETDPALARWVRSHSADLKRFLAKRRIVESDIKDVCQEVYLRMLRFRREEVVTHPLSYLFRVAANVAHDFKLREGKYTSLELETLDQMGVSPSAEQIVTSENQRKALLKALERLPALPRAALSLQVNEDLTYDEIAVRLNVSHRVIKRAIVRGHLLMRETLAQEYKT